MKDKLVTALAITFFVVGNILFFFYMQASPSLCDGLGYPVCP